MNTTEYKKLKSVIKGKLLGMAAIDKDYLRAVNAFNFAEKIHSGFRKDGVTPEFYHQLSILGYAISLHALIDQACSVYVSILLHDVDEDYPGVIDELKTLREDDLVRCKTISKKEHFKLANGRYESVLKDTEQYFSEISKCPVSSVSKGLDRSHNLSTMAGVFTLDKQLNYAKQVESDFLPMLKIARILFPSQEPVYEIIKSNLSLQSYAAMHYIEEIMKKTN